MGKIGYHINLQGLRQQAEEVQQHAKDIGAPFHLIMTNPPNGINGDDEIANVDDWANAFQPAQIVWRTKSNVEGDWTVFASNEEIVKRWLDEDRPQYIRDDPFSEPSLVGNDPKANSRYVQSRTDLLRMAAIADIKVAVGAFRVGTPSHDLIADGTYDDLIRAVVEGGHYFSVHEYCPGIPGAGDVFPYENLLKPHRVIKNMKVEQWPSQVDYRLLRRSDHFVLRAREIGLSDPQIIVTESFIDLIPYAKEVLEQLKDKYGIPAYNKELGGVLAWRMYYADAFPEKPFSEVVTQLTKYMEENVYYPEYIKGVCLFSLDWEQDTPEAHNYLDAFLNDFRKNGLPNLANQESILELVLPKAPSDADTISTRSPEFWAELRDAVEELPFDNDEPNNVDISEDSTADGIPVGVSSVSHDMRDDTTDKNAVIRASSTVEIPAIALEQLGSRWQEGTFHSEGVRIRVAPFTDAEPLGLLSGERNGQQHVGDIQSDGYTWRWIRYVHHGNLIEGYAASAFYEFKAN